MSQTAERWTSNILNRHSCISSAADIQMAKSDIGSVRACCAITGTVYRPAKLHLSGVLAVAAAGRPTSLTVLCRLHAIPSVSDVGRLERAVQVAGSNERIYRSLRGLEKTA